MEAKNSLEEYDFNLFFAIWMVKMGFKIPNVHFTMMNFLENAEWTNRTKILLLHRGIGKTQMLCLYVAYRLSKDPTLRVLMLAGAWEEATENVSTVLNIINRHPLCNHLISRKNETRRDRFYVNGFTDGNNPSVKAKSITGTITGGRADLICYDDVEMPRTCGTDIKRKDLRKRISEAKHNLIPRTGQKLFVGTYHDPISAYDEEIANGANVLRIPIIENAKGEWPYMDGDLQWPDRFTREVVFQLQKDCGGGKSEFYSQYMLIPTSIKDSRFDVSKIKSYDEELDFISSNGSVLVKLGDKTIAGVSAFWDPSSGKHGRDKSVLALVLTDYDGHIYIHRTANVSDPDYDRQATNVKNLALEFHLPTITVEKNGIGQMIVQILQKHCIPKGIGVMGKHTTGNKQERIIESLETPLFSGRLHAHKSVLDSPFFAQMRDFDPMLNQQADDFIDAAASAVKMQPCRINVLHANGNLMAEIWGFDQGFAIEAEHYEF